MKRVVGDNATLPCHHQFWVGEDPTLDIEWLLLKPTNRVVSDSPRQIPPPPPADKSTSLSRQVITYFAGRVFDPNEAERGRVAFAGEYLKGDASLTISDLSLTDSGEYSCKVKTGARYHWSTIRLIVLGRWQTRRARFPGEGAVKKPPNAFSVGKCDTCRLKASLSKGAQRVREEGIDIPQ